MGGLTYEKPAMSKTYDWVSDFVRRIIKIILLIKYPQWYLHLEQTDNNRNVPHMKQKYLKQSFDFKKQKKKKKKKKKKKGAFPLKRWNLNV